MRYEVRDNQGNTIGELLPLIGGGDGGFISLLKYAFILLMSYCGAGFYIKVLTGIDIPITGWLNESTLDFIHSDGDDALVLLARAIIPWVIGLVILLVNIILKGEHKEIRGYILLVPVAIFLSCVVIEFVQVYARTGSFFGSLFTEDFWGIGVFTGICMIFYMGTFPILIFLLLFQLEQFIFNRLKKNSTK